MEKLIDFLYIIREIIINYTPEILIFLIIIFIVLLISVLASNYKYKKLLIRYNNLVRNFNGQNLEELILYLQNNVNDLNANVNIIKLDIASINKELNFAIQKVGYITYDAFDNVGNEMSYSLAILNKFKNGLILTNIYGRNHNMSYAKDIKDGESKKKLSAEEIIALDRALNSQIER